MKFSIDQTLRQKIYVCKDDTKIFYFDFPSNSNVTELYEVISELQKAVYESVEAEKKEKEETKIVEMPKEEICEKTCFKEEPK